ncbi:Bug family tripartite tricarboxylate transporter substrate binding protein [Sabulicella rubraurantiaca]|uniref:Bug family tripartite tricarboxylate transporter substrate binding protein n=1 Tax=Sabulicella rubraurantiaca TaxID=2811429 RepID=UPI001A95EC01|nr:tripartite tricarboxylate transporter substrate binding protein [Sabulicella rubraurantiaca]
MIARRTLALGALLAPPAPLRAQGFPQRPVRLVIPYAPGGLADIMSRIMAQGMGDVLGQPVVPESRPGAATIIGHQQTAQAPPDGHTMVFTSGAGYVTNPLLYRNMPFDAQRDLRVFGIVAETPFVMIVHRDFPARTVQDFVEGARQRRGGLNYASVGRGNPLELAAEMFRMAAGIEMQGVVYNGSAPSHLALQRGEAHMMFDVLGNAMPQIRDGVMRPLAVASKTRHPMLPDVPTLAESGFPDYSADTWFGLATHRAAPDAAVARLREALAHVQRDEAFIRRFTEAGMTLPGPMEESAIEARIAEEREKWRRVIQANGISLEMR